MKASQLFLKWLHYSNQFGSCSGKAFFLQTWRSWSRLRFWINPLEPTVNSLNSTLPGSLGYFLVCWSGDGHVTLGLDSKMVVSPIYKCAQVRHNNQTLLIVAKSHFLIYLENHHDRMFMEKLTFIVAQQGFRTNLGALPRCQRAR